MPPACEAMASEMLAAVPPGPQLLPIAFDFADLASCQVLVEQTLDRFGRIDVLVNVATAGGETSAVAEGEWQSWRRAFEVNVIGTMELSRLAAEAMSANPGGFHRAGRNHRDAGAAPGPGPLHGDEERHGHRLPHHGQGSRPIPRPGQRGDAGLRDGRAAHGAMIESIATRTGESADEVSARMAAGASLRRHVDPADVAAAVVFLAGPGARNITGMELPVTAGR